jgi:hypothetical protein
MAQEIESLQQSLHVSGQWLAFYVNNLQPMLACTRLHQPDKHGQRCACDNCQTAVP